MFGVNNPSPSVKVNCSEIREYEYRLYSNICITIPISIFMHMKLRTRCSKPPFDVSMGEHKISWVNSFRYLGYVISCRLGWGTMISTYKCKIRQRVAIVRSCRMYGTSSRKFKRILFETYVRPLFTWLFCIFPLLTECQRDDLGHFYLTCLKRTLGIPYWNDLIFSALNEEKSLESLCTRYWIKYRKALNNSADGLMLYEQSCFNLFRNLWLDKKYVVTLMYRSKRVVPYVTTIEKALNWTENNAEDSIPSINESHLDLFTSFPESFL
jgi:hypothetical protein